MDFIDIPLRTIRFHGPMIKVFGREFKYRAPTVPKAIDAMKNLLPGFERYMLEAHKRGLTFSIFVGKRNVGQDELEFTKGSEDIHLVPVVIGSKRAGLFQTILGVALIGAAIAFSPAGLGVFSATGGWTSMAYAGASLALGGVVQMLSPQMGGLRMRQGPENKPSYAFGGPVNTTAQGNPVGVLYGTREIGGAIISAGIYTEDQQ
ncbi:TPA: tail assembly protein [Serratia marcescens]|jgi:predicted phage tail protein|uniref:tail assembly protein n=1 Tax=Serratia TaxID=613 RepID=UPI000927EC86|nr:MULTISPECIES: tail assembly protein [Serratia]MBH2685057.1 tail assembly protein [Serratia ureilytica]MBZ0048238.1 tail assembly protein [Serratia sp. EWG9]MDP8755172.1 tail assembly protein [Serratia marcescens]MDP8759833.1 tail assembly protein [Serratia marcescens]MDP8769574.1 tail assembly protein [Serratia marcescens]